MLGLIAGLRDTHLIYSNRESGHGRYDAALLPKAGSAPDAPAVLLEFKQTAADKGLQAAAQEALAQIDARHYQTQLRQYPVAKVLLMGLAFSGKDVAVAHRVENTAS